MREILSKNIKALIPFYTEEGCNASLIKTAEGDIIIEKKVKRVLKDICLYYKYDLEGSNKEYGQSVNLKKTPPIPIRPDLIFIAAKTRIPVGKNDGAFSYINISNIGRVKDKAIYFKNGEVLNTITNTSTIVKNINLANTIKDSLFHKNQSIRGSITSHFPDKQFFRENCEIIYTVLRNIEGNYLG